MAVIGGYLRVSVCAGVCSLSPPSAPLLCLPRAPPWMLLPVIHPQLPPYSSHRLAGLLSPWELGVCLVPLSHDSPAGAGRQLSSLLRQPFNARHRPRGPPRGASWATCSALIKGQSNLERKGKKAYGACYSCESRHVGVNQAHLLFSSSGLLGQPNGSQPCLLSRVFRI